MNRLERQGIERYAYCLCMHVKPGTIFIGVINLTGSLVCGILYLVLLGYHQSGNDYVSHHRSTTTSLAIIIYMMCATVSAMLLYGVIKSRPSYLMPFFGIQLCDFFFTLPNFLTSLYLNPTNHYEWDPNNPNGSVSTQSSSGFIDMKRFLPNATSRTLHTSTLLLTTCIILFKAYFLCIVWKCYRYLKMKEMILPIHIPSLAQNQPEIMIPSGVMMPPPPPMSMAMAPPDYETATKVNAPPDYEYAIKNDEEYKIPPSLMYPLPASEVVDDRNEQDGRSQQGNATGGGQMA